MRLEESQAAAAAGQVRLAQAYVDAFHVHDIAVAQILLTLEDTEERRRYLNARETLTTLLTLNAVPVINENDTVATAEIRYGDNDRLAARVASMMEADMLVLLSDIDGLYTANPQRDSNAKHIPEVRAITPEIERMAEGPVSGLQQRRHGIEDRGGEDRDLGGCRRDHRQRPCHASLARDCRAARTTLFVPRVSPAQAKKRWIAGGLSALGTVVIDAGAERALLSGKSLLPAGVKSVSGAFRARRRGGGEKRRRARAGARAHRL